MLGNQKPDRNVEDLTNEEIHTAIHYLEHHSESNEKKEDDGGPAIAVILLVLACGLIAFMWLYR